MQQPQVLRKPGRGLFEKIELDYFDGRGTVSFFMVHRHHSIDSVMLVTMMGSGNLMFPQGEIIGKDEKPYDALLRNGFAQFGLRDSHVQKRECLGEFINPMPPERKSGCEQKHVVVVWLRVSSMNWVVPKGRKYKEEVTWVSSPADFLQLITPGNRPVKIAAMCEAVNRAHERGLLSWSLQGMTH